MKKPERRLITRHCAVCEWKGESVESQISDADCPLCHAPARVIREEWVLNPVEVRAEAAEYGRQGGLKGGRARAERLSATRRREIARKAAAARWHK